MEYHGGGIGAVLRRTSQTKVAEASNGAETLRCSHNLLGESMFLQALDEG